MAQLHDPVGVVEALERLLENSSGITDIGNAPLGHVFHREGDVRGDEYAFAFGIHVAPFRAVGSDVPALSLPSKAPGEEG